MHLCKVQIVLELHLSQINNSHPLKIRILNTHLPTNVLIMHTPQINQ
jgi:hypothetical protein